MAAATPPEPGTDDFSWHVASRWQEFEGETRANALRILSVVAFYIVELVSYRGLNLGFLQIPSPQEITPELHRSVTLIVGGWVFLALGVHFCLHHRILPAYLKYVVSALDISLLSVILMLGTGPKSPMVAGYFVLIGLAAQRFSLPLIRATTVGCMVGYLAVCGHVLWAKKLEYQVPRYHELLVLSALALVGIAIGQVIRRVRRFAEDFHERVNASNRFPSTPAPTANGSAEK